MRFPAIHEAVPTIRSRAARLSAAMLALAAAVPQAASAFTGDPLHPLGSDTTVEIIVGRVVTIILGLLGSLSLVMFVFGGLTWMTAQGNEEKIKKAKNTIVYSVFGLLVSFGAYAILRTFFNMVLGPAAFGAPST